MQARLFENLPFGIVMCYIAVRIIVFLGHIRIVGSLHLRNGSMFKGMLLLTVWGPGLTFKSLKSNKVNLKIESYLYTWMFAREKLESWHSKEQFFVKDALLGLAQFFPTEYPLKMMENAFYFTYKALFILKIFKFLS